MITIKTVSPRHEFTLTNRDWIVDNGVCFILISKSVFNGWSYVHPTISKKLFEELFIAGNLKLAKRKYHTEYRELDIYDVKVGKERDKE